MDDGLLFNLLNFKWASFAEYFRMPVELPRESVEKNFFQVVDSETLERMLQNLL